MKTYCESSWQLGHNIFIYVAIFSLVKNVCWWFCLIIWPPCLLEQGGGPRVVVSTAAFHARVRGSVPGLGGLKETKLFLPHPRVKVSIVGSLRDREVAFSASDRQDSNFESCVWRTVSSQSSHHPQEVLLAQFSLYVHKGGLKPDSFHFILSARTWSKFGLMLGCCSSHSVNVVKQNSGSWDNKEFNPLTASAAYIRVFIFISTFSTTF